MRRLGTKLWDKFILTHSKPTCHEPKMALGREPWPLSGLGLAGPGQAASLPVQKVPGDALEMTVLMLSGKVAWEWRCIRLQTSPFKLS